MAALRGADYALLGELHDNALHHARRGELLEALADTGLQCRRCLHSVEVDLQPAVHTDGSSKRAEPRAATLLGRDGRSAEGA